MGWFFSFGTNASVLSCNNVGRYHFYRRLLTCIPSLRAHDLARPRHRSCAVAPVRWVEGSQRSRFIMLHWYRHCWINGAGRFSFTPPILLTSVPATMISSRRCQCVGSATVPLKTLSRLPSALFAPSIDWTVPMGSNDFRVAGNMFYAMVGTTSRAYETWNHLGEPFIQL